MRLKFYRLDTSAEWLERELSSYHFARSYEASPVFAKREDAVAAARWIMSKILARGHVDWMFSATWNGDTQFNRAEEWVGHRRCGPGENEDRRFFGTTVQSDDCGAWIRAERWERRIVKRWKETRVAEVDGVKMTGEIQHEETVLGWEPIVMTRYCLGGDSPVPVWGETARVRVAEVELDVLQWCVDADGEGRALSADEVEEKL